MSRSSVPEPAPGADVAEPEAEPATATAPDTDGTAAAPAIVPTDDPRAGRAIVQTDLIGTLSFLVAGALGLASKSLRSVTVIVSLVLFAVGTAVFIWSYFTAAERSRTAEIGVANLFLLTGPTAPARVKRVMGGCLTVQTVACLAFGAAGFSGLSTTQVNVMAFGILVPMLGIGLNGLWASRHGAFGPRIVSEPARRRRPVAPSDHDLEKNARHG